MRQVNPIVTVIFSPGQYTVRSNETLNIHLTLKGRSEGSTCVFMSWITAKPAVVSPRMLPRTIITSIFFFHITVPPSLIYIYHSIRGMLGTSLPGIILLIFSFFFLFFLLSLLPFMERFIYKGTRNERWVLRISDMKGVDLSGFSFKCS